MPDPAAPKKRKIPPTPKGADRPDRMVKGKVYGLKAAPTAPEVRPSTPELDERVANLMDATAGNAEAQKSQIVALAKEYGINPNAVELFLTRMKNRYAPFDGTLRKFSTDRFLELLDDRLGRALEYLDDHVLSQASARDLAVVVGIIAEKRQLLRGEPTAILSIEDRMKLNELLPALLNELQRRNMTPDMASVGGDIAVPFEHRKPVLLQMKNDKLNGLGSEEKIAARDHVRDVGPDGTVE